MIVTLDGPAGSGKSTTARLVAERLGWLYLDTGALYRAVALAFVEAGADCTEEDAQRVVEGLEVHADRPAAPGGPMRVRLGDADVTSRLRTPEVSVMASRISSLKTVRDALLDVQRAVAREQAAATGGAVLDGRDTGTVVFPDADVKVFMQADLAARARRRHAELARRLGLGAPDIDAVKAEITERDARDSTRAIAPLKAADDAVLLDTTRLTLDEQVDRVVAMVQQKRG
jgi:cytidylate kinase